MPDQHANRPPVPQTQRQSRLSNDGQWRSFPKVPNLLQYVGSGSYYARIKLHGKTIRRSLDTDVFTTAKLKLLDFLKEEQKKRTAVAPPTFAEAQQLYEQQLDNDLAVLGSECGGARDSGANESHCLSCRELIYFTR